MANHGCELCGRDDRARVRGLAATVMRCRGCGLIHRWPRPSASDLERHYAETYYVDQERIGAERLNRARAPVFAKVLASWNRRGLGGKLLDVGAGYGGFVRLAIDHGFDAIGVEISESACKDAATHLGVTVLPGALSDALRERGPFDLITLWNVLDQMASPVVELQRIRTLLTPGGMVAIRVPNVAFHRFIHTVFQSLNAPLTRLGIEDPSIFMTWSFSATTLRAILERSGYRDVHISNSDLTAGDPYRSLRLGQLGARAMKTLASGVAAVVAAMSEDRLIAPSLYAEASSPESTQRDASTVATSAAITS